MEHLWSCIQDLWDSLQDFVSQRRKSYETSFFFDKLTHTIHISTLSGPQEQQILPLIYIILELETNNKKEIFQIIKSFN